MGCRHGTLRWDYMLWWCRGAQWGAYRGVGSSAPRCCGGHIKCQCPGDTTPLPPFLPLPPFVTLGWGTVGRSWGVQRVWVVALGSSSARGVPRAPRRASLLAAAPTLV